MKPAALPLVFALLLLPPLAAQEIEDPGPFPVGWRDVTFLDTVFGRGTIDGRIFYPAQSAGKDAPADPASGPYPLVAFEHGFTDTPSDYKMLSKHVASWGFVVASIGTETGLSATMQVEALDTRSLLHWVDDQSATPGTWLAGMAAPGDWAASGHSMGGGSLMYLIAAEPRVRLIVPLEPYRGPLLGGSAGGEANLAAFDGRAFFVAGEVDGVVPPFTKVHVYFEEAGLAPRDLFYLVLGGGHSGSTDSPPTNEPLSAPEQQRVHRLVVAGVLRAESLGEEDLFYDLLGEGLLADPLSFESDSEDPPFWAQESALQPGTLAEGLAGGPGDRALLAWSLVPASKPTPFGILGLKKSALVKVFDGSLSSPDGAVEVRVPGRASWRGRTLYLQGLVRNGATGRLTRVVAIAVP